MADTISYQEYIPTDRWSLQDWYLMKMVRIERIYTTLMRGWYGGGVDRRALVEFYSEVRGYYRIARQNLEKHLSEEQMAVFVLLSSKDSDKVGLEDAEQIMDLLGVFHWTSGLSKLSESKPMGPFAYARTRRGISPDKDASIRTEDTL